MRRTPQPPAIYALADAAVLGGVDRVPAAAGEMAAAGVRWIQLRMKPRPPQPPPADRDLYAAVEAAVRATAEHGAELWIDDRADLAALFPIAGLHLGQRDLPPAAARRVVGDEVWIGASAHDDAELAAAVDDPQVDVVAVGPVYPTASKERPDAVVGLDFVRRARRTTTKPLVAIGGLDADNLGDVLEAGADAVAVLSAACRRPVAESCRALLAAAAGRSR